MSGDSILRWYDGHSESLLARYESLDPTRVHGWLLPHFPPGRGGALDVGAGSGRDAGWLAHEGFAVLAAEPSTAMRAEAMARHSSSRIRWLDDRLPALTRVRSLGEGFDLVLASAVWMHLDPMERACALETLVALLNPGGLLAITFRQGGESTERGFHAIPDDELPAMGQRAGLRKVHRSHSSDLSGREAIRWTQLAFRRGA